MASLRSEAARIMIARAWLSMGTSSVSSFGTPGRPFCSPLISTVSAAMRPAASIAAGLAVAHPRGLAGLGARAAGPPGPLRRPPAWPKLCPVEHEARTTLTTLACLAVLAGCSAWPGARGESGPASPSGSPDILVESVTLATEVDHATLEPRGTTGRTFPAGTTALHLCFRVVRGSGGAVVVAWQRPGEPEPYGTSRLVVTGPRRMVASHEAITGLEPGEHVARLSAGEQVLAEVPFVVEADQAGAPARAGPVGPSVSPLEFRVDQGGRPVDPPTTVMPPGTRRVHAAFVASGAGPETRLEVRWTHAGARLATSHLAVPAGDAPRLEVSLERTAPLAAGLYRVEVSASGSLLRAGTFTVLGDPEPGTVGPRVENLVLSREADERTGRPTGPHLTAVWTDEPVLYLTFRFAGMGEGDRLEVRWHRDATPGEPLAVGTFEVGQRGSLAASLEPGEPLEPGPHHADVVRAGTVLGTRRFVVVATERGEGSPDDPPGVE